jgi:hypothetical protein
LVAGVEHTVAAIFDLPQQGKRPGETCCGVLDDLICTCRATVLRRHNFK